MLYHKYRPRTFDQLVGHPQAVAQVRRILAGGWGGRAWWISGPSGTGKTSLAYLIAREGADGWLTEEIDASDLTPQRLKEIESTMQLLGFGGKSGRAWIVNEAHGLRHSAVIRQLLTLLERLPSHVVWIFTTTDHGEQLLLDDLADADPMLSRCHRITLKPNLPAFAAVARRVAKAEGRDGLPPAVYRRLADETGGNLRAMLGAIESGALPASTPRRRSPVPPKVERRGVCPVCGKACKGRFCSVEHYFQHLKANKRRR